MSEIEAKDFWVMAALDFDKDEAWILASSEDVQNCDLVDGRAVSDSIAWNTKDAVPGLYKLTLKPWSHSDYEGVYDSGIDVQNAELIVSFPDPQCGRPLSPEGTADAK